MTFENSVHDLVMSILSTTKVPKVTYTDPGADAFVAQTIEATATQLPTQAELGVTAFRMVDSVVKLGAAYKADIRVMELTAYVNYAVQVSLEKLAEAFSRTVAASGTQRQYDLRLISIEHEAPPRVDPQSGSFAVLQIEAVPVLSG